MIPEKKLELAEDHEFKLLMESDGDIQESLQDLVGSCPDRLLELIRGKDETELGRYVKDYVVTDKWEQAKKVVRENKRDYL